MFISNGVNVRTFSTHLPKGWDIAYLRLYRKTADLINKNRLLRIVKKLYLVFIEGTYAAIRARVIFSRIKHPAPTTNFTVLFLTLRDSPTPLLIYLDAIFAHAFMRLGARAKLIFTDGVLSSTDAKTVFIPDKETPVWERMHNSFLRVKQALGVPFISYREVVSKKDIQTIHALVNNLKPSELGAYTYLGVNVGAHAKISAIRYFLAGNLDITNKKHLAMLKEKLILAMINTKAAQTIIGREQPDALITLHGIYATWGPFRNYCTQQGVDTIIYSNMSPRYGYFMFNRNTDPNDIVSKKTWQERKQKPLTKKMQASLEKFFNNRTKKKTDDQQLFDQIRQDYSKEDAKKTLLAQLNQGTYQHRFVLFSNLTWDALIEGSVSPIFNDVFEWIDEHIAFFKTKPSYQLIIKPHPGEKIWEKTTQSISQYIAQRHGQLPANIIVLPADTPLSAYDLQELNPINIVFNGTLGVELPAFGYPLLVGANFIHYSDAGVVMKITSRAHYRQLLGDPSPLCAFAKKHEEDAKKYAYFYFFSSMIRIPFYSNTIWSEFDWQKVRDYSWLEPDSNIMKIARRITERKDIYNPL